MVQKRNPGGGEIFRTRPDRPWGPPSLLYNGYRVFPGGKAAEAWCWPPTPTYPPGRELVELYLYSPSGPCVNWPSENHPVDTGAVPDGKVYIASGWPLICFLPRLMLGGIMDICHRGLERNNFICYTFTSLHRTEEVNRLRPCRRCWLSFCVLCRYLMSEILEQNLNTINNITLWLKLFSIWYLLI
jgi:hypothetical protein